MENFTETARISESNNDMSESEYSDEDYEQPSEKFLFFPHLEDEYEEYTDEEHEDEEHGEYIDEENEEYVDEEHQDTYNDDNINIVEEPTMMAEVPAIQLTKCVVTTKKEDIIQRCKNYNDRNQKGLWTLVGTWEIDKSAIQEMENETFRLGVCDTHYIADMNRMHPEHFKQQKSCDKAVICNRRCTFCKRIFRVYSRGNGCEVHARSFLGKETEIPCNGQYMCPATESSPPLAQKIAGFNIKQSQYVCCKCYEAHGGHIHEHHGKGRREIDYICTATNKHTTNKHDNDVDKSLKLLGNWILHVAKTNTINILMKKIILYFVAQALQVLKMSDSDLSSSSHASYNLTPFAINTILKSNRMASSSPDDVSLGKEIAEKIWNLRSSLKEQEKTLELPETLSAYKDAQPQILTGLFDDMISTFYTKRKEVNSRKKGKSVGRNRDIIISKKEQKKIDMITTFLSSVILTTAFKNMKIWITRSLASACQNSKLLPSLRSCLEAVNAVSHTSVHEYRLRRQRMQAADPIERLRTDPFTWNVCVIDNIDLREATFKYGNIYNIAGRSFHATLRMVFQFKLPQEINSIPDNEIHLTEEHHLFGEDNKVEAWFHKINNNFRELIANSADTNGNITIIDNFVATINDKLREGVQLGCRIEKPNVVILAPGPKPSSNINIFQTCRAYYTDFGIAEGSNLDVWADQAIHQRLIKIKNKKYGQLRAGLGQWHTSKDMCAALIHLFSSYGIYNLAHELGVRFYDKLATNIDYRATCKVLDLIWASTGIAIHYYVRQKNFLLEQLMECDNNMVKTWFLYFKWASIWKGHKLGIRTGNYDMQFSNLAAFAPLFPSASKPRYSKSVVFFLAEITRSPQLQRLLQHACSVNLTNEGHYFAFDEALEFFGVQFVKQNLTKRIISEENLKCQITAIQSERTITDHLFSIFNNDHTSRGGSVHAANYHNESVWRLAKLMLEAFTSEIPENHKLFRGCSSPNYDNLFGCYEDGMQRLIALYRQEVICVDPINTKGRNRSAVDRKNPNELPLNDPTLQEAEMLDDIFRPDVFIDNNSSHLINK
jgi:hypothetical protein